MTEQEENALLWKLTMELVEGYRQTVMALHEQGVLQPPLRGPMLLRLQRIAEMLDGATSADLPHELPTHLHTTAVRLLRQQDRDQPPE